MATPLRVRARTRAFGITTADTTFAARGLRPGAPAAQAALEGHAASFVTGYNAALAALDVADVEQPLAELPDEQRGFAYEGTGMALTLLDLMTPGSGSRVKRLLAGPGEPHVYTILAGVGWALARLRLRPRERAARLDPFLRWIAVDGYGFHEGLFRHRRFVTAQARPRRLRGYERRAFDHGLGRSLWFFTCADVDRAAAVIDGFDADRRADLWSGIGLAATYTVVASPQQLERLREVAGGFAPQLTVGSALAATMRVHGRNVVDHTCTAAEILCGRSVEQLAGDVDAARAGLVPDATGDSYELWRTRVRDRLAAAHSAA